MAVQNSLPISNTSGTRAEWLQVEEAWYTTALVLMLELLLLPPLLLTAAAAAAMIRALTVSTGTSSAKGSDAYATPLRLWKNPAA